MIISRGDIKMNNHVLTTKELADYLSVSEGTVYNMVKEGEIPAAKIGRSWRFLRPAIDKWLEDLMLKNLYQPIERTKEIEFIPHALGKINGDLSREEIYSDR